MKENKNAANVIITGVGGQGNVLASQLLGQAFVSKGYYVTIGETYGASQRGGPVMSHIRISKNRQLSPLIPKGKGDIVLALEPVEALRVLAVYGNPDVVVLVNTRPIYPVDVTAGNENYPKIEEIQERIHELSASAYYIEATEKAVRMGSPVLGNMIMIGALLELKLLPLSVEEFCETLSNNLAGRTLDINLQAVEEGKRAVQHDD